MLPGFEPVSASRAHMTPENCRRYIVSLYADYVSAVEEKTRAQKDCRYLAMIEYADTANDIHRKMEQFCQVQEDIRQFMESENEKQLNKAAKE